MYIKLSPLKYFFHKKNQFIKMYHVEVLKSTVYIYHSIKVAIIKR